MTSEFPIQFHVTPKKPHAHLFEVRCVITAPDPAGQAFSLPVWIPGSYLIREFARNIVQLQAWSGDRPVTVQKLDKCTWRCDPCAGPLVVIYEVYAWELSVRSAHLDDSHGYFNGTSVFIKVHGKESQPHGVTLVAPEGDAYRPWRVATTLTRLDALPYGFGGYHAADYDELVDHPVEMGEFTLSTFHACGIPHDVVISGRHRADLDRLCRDLQRVCEQQIRFFGELPPMSRYMFLVTVVDQGYGGLEHRASCSLLCSRDDLPHARQQEVGDKYRTFLGLCSHEYFHLWHVKRIRPAAFAPYDLNRENYTGLLWAFEGITTYYQNLMLLRCGLITAESYLELLAQTITRVWRGAGRHKQSLVESSFDAWIKFYRQDENAVNAIVNYYAKGALVALALDLLIRSETGGAHSLDEVMLALWQRYGKTGIGLPEDGLERLAEEISGLDLKGFFTEMVHGMADPPLVQLLGRFGIHLELRPAVSMTDKGGQRGKASVETLLQRPALGVNLAEGGGDAKIAQVFDGGSAQRAGLAAGDVIVAVDRLRVTRNNLETLLAVYQPGETVTIDVFRRDELRTYNVLLQPPPADTCVLSLCEDVNDALRITRDAWMKG